MFASLFFNGFAQIGASIVKLIYGKEETQRMKEEYPDEFKRRSSGSFAILLVGIMIGVLLTTKAKIVLCGLIFDCICYGVWSIVVKGKLSVFSIVCIVLIAAVVVLNVFLYNYMK